MSLADAVAERRAEEHKVRERKLKRRKTKGERIELERVTLELEGVWKRSLEKVIEPLPSPSRLDVAHGEFSPVPRREVEVFKASIWRTLLRVLSWAWPFIYFGWHVAIDFVRLRITWKRSAAHMVGALQRAGGTFVKIGQQMSTRFDLLPAEACYEFSKLRDDAKPIPAAEAVAIIERATGQPFEQTFSTFDPEPLSSGTIACVYHAILTTGEEVAVKIRRPGIGAVFASDLFALDLLLRTFELLTIIRPGFTYALRTELRALILEELDFEMEARYQELFRAQAITDQQDHVTAPLVFHALSTKEVLVTEYVHGVWLYEILNAVQDGEVETVAHFRSMGMSPKRIARRLLRVRHWAIQENLFFHADPDPSNIVVLPGNRLVFVDFGSCAPTATRMRRENVQLFRNQARDDVDGMVQVLNSMLSPLPHLDLDEFNKTSEAHLWRWIYGFKSKNSRPWEHTSAGMWIRLFDATRDFGVPVNLDTIRLMRASILYDAVAVALYPKIEVLKEFKKYEREAERRVIERFLKRLSKTRPGELVMMTERGMELGARMIYRLHRLADQPTTTFLATIGKAAHTTINVLRLLLLTAIATFGAIAVVVIQNRANDVQQSTGEILVRILESPIYWIVLAVAAIRNYRVIQYRLKDTDEQG